MTGKYPESIKRDIRQYLDLDENDMSQDDTIDRMPPRQVFRDVVQWNGLLGGYDSTILNWVDGIYKVDLRDK